MAFALLQQRIFYLDNGQVPRSRLTLHTRCVLAGHGTLAAPTGWPAHLGRHVGGQRSDVDVGEQAIVEHLHGSFTQRLVHAPLACVAERRRTS